MPTLSAWFLGLAVGLAGGLLLGVFSFSIALALVLLGVFVAFSLGIWFLDSRLGSDY
jgi:hypothetical protein